MRNRVREFRAARGWTQADLAGQLSVSRQTIHAIEVGKYDPSLPLAFRIAKLFEHTVEAVFDDDPKGLPATAQPAVSDVAD